MREGPGEYVGAPDSIKTEESEEMEVDGILPQACPS